MDNSPNKKSSIRENLRKLIVPFIFKVLQDKPSNFVEYGADYFQNLSDPKKSNRSKIPGESDKKKCKTTEKDGKRATKLHTSVSVGTLIDENSKEVDLRETSSWGHPMEKKPQKQHHKILYNRADFAAKMGDSEQKNKVTGDKTKTVSGNDLKIVAENEKLVAERLSQGDSFSRSKPSLKPEDDIINDLDPNQLPACSEIDNYLSELVDRASALCISAEKSPNSRKRWEKETMEPFFKTKTSVFPEVDSSGEDSGSDTDDNENYGYFPLFDEAEKGTRNIEKNIHTKDSNSKRKDHHGNVPLNHNLMFIRINELVNNFSQTFHNLIFKLRAAELDFNQKLQIELINFFQNLSKVSDKKRISYNDFYSVLENRFERNTREDIDNDLEHDYNTPTCNRPIYAIKRNLTGSQKLMNNEPILHLGRNCKPQFVVPKHGVELSSIENFKAKNECFRNKRIKGEPPDDKDVLKVFYEASAKRNSKINTNSSDKFSPNVDNSSCYKPNIAQNSANQEKGCVNDKMNYIQSHKTKPQSNEGSSSFKFGRKNRNESGNEDSFKDRRKIPRQVSAICRPFSANPQGIHRVSPMTFPLQIGEQGDVIPQPRRQIITQRVNKTPETSDFKFHPNLNITNNTSLISTLKERNESEYQLPIDKLDGTKCNRSSNTAQNIEDVERKIFFDGLINNSSLTLTEIQSNSNGKNNFDLNIRNEGCSSSREGGHDNPLISVEDSRNPNESLSVSNLSKQENNKIDQGKIDATDPCFTNGHTPSNGKTNANKEENQKNLDTNSQCGSNDEDVKRTIASGSVSKCTGVQFSAEHQNGVVGNSKQDDKIGSEASISEGGDRFLKQEIVSQTLMKQTLEPGLTSAGGDFVVSQNEDGGQAREQQQRQNILDDAGISIALVESAVKEALKARSKADDDMEFDYFSDNDSSECCSSELSEESYSEDNENLIPDAP